MKQHIHGIAALCLMLAGLVCEFASASEQRPALPDLRAALAGHVQEIALAEGELVGPGRERLAAAFADARFVLLAEEHNNADIPALTVALFTMLQRERGFQYFATEQDPLALQRLSREPLRGRPDAAVELARRYPQALPFVSDQELQMLGAIAALSEARHEPLWGVEQAYGASHYLERLVELAPTDTARQAATALHALAHEAEQRRDGQPQRRWLSRGVDSDTLDQFARSYAAIAGGEAASWIESLKVSQQIYANYLAAAAGQTTGMLSNWQREDWMKQRFAESYRMARFVENQPPGVLIKGGGWHIRRGLGPGSVYTLGSMVHELALFEGSVAVGLDLVAFSDRQALANRPALGMLAEHASALGCARWCLIDLRPLRSLMHHLAFLDELERDTWRLLHRQVFGFDLMLLMPGSGPGSWTLTGGAP